MPEKRNTLEEKAHAVLLNLQDNVPVNEICIQFGITPTCFYQWRNYFLASAKSVFEGTGRKEQKECRHCRSSRGVHTAKKRVWGTLSRGWVPLAIRDDVVSFVRRMHQECGASICQFCSYIEITPQRFADWQKRVGTENRHNCRIPRKNRVLPEEHRQIMNFSQEHREDGYRRYAHMMRDQNLVAVSPSTFYNVLREADALRKIS